SRRSRLPSPRREVAAPELVLAHQQVLVEGARELRAPHALAAHRGAQEVAEGTAGVLAVARARGLAVREQEVEQHPELEEALLGVVHRVGVDRIADQALQRERAL